MFLPISQFSQMRKHANNNKRNSKMKSRMIMKIGIDVRYT